jgi:hypothetical protein
MQYSGSTVQTINSVEFKNDAVFTTHSIDNAAAVNLKDSILQ